MRYLCLIVLMLHSFNVNSSATFSSLNSGLNQLDLNSDGILDAVFYSRFDNNTSHPDPTLSTYIKNDDSAYSIVPTPAGDRFTLFGINVAVSNVLLRSFGFIKKSQTVYLVISIKSGHAPHLKQFFKFELYRIKKNLDYPGVALFSWQKEKEIVSKRKYMSADIAINECLTTCFELAEPQKK